MRARDLAFEALCDELNVDWRQLTQSGRGAINRALGEIRAVADEEGLPAEIHRRAAIYRQAFEHIVLTGPGLAKHRAAMANEQPKQPKGSAARLLRWADEQERKADHG